MPSEYVIHVAGPVYSEGQDNEELLAAAVLGALETATELDAMTIAVPAISAGIFGYPADEAASVIAETAAAFLSEESTSLRGVRLVGYDDAMTYLFTTSIASMDMSFE
jgi:O-acetyl-ADP-ribose deacetylase (regulator of RNase III)